MVSTEFPKSKISLDQSYYVLSFVSPVSVKFSESPEIKLIFFLCTLLGHVSLLMIPSTAYRNGKIVRDHAFRISEFLGTFLTPSPPYIRIYPNLPPAPPAPPYFRISEFSMKNIVQTFLSPRIFHIYAAPRTSHVQGIYKMKYLCTM